MKKLDENIIKWQYKKKLLKIMFFKTNDLNYLTDLVFFKSKIAKDKKDWCTLTKCRSTDKKFNRFRLLIRSLMDISRLYTD